ncbi:MAG: hypothetical protein AB7S38_42430 [Vulcanimicrobiota bacterium]
MIVAIVGLVALMGSSEEVNRCYIIRSAAKPGEAFGARRDFPDVRNWSIVEKRDIGAFEVLCERATSLSFGRIARATITRRGERTDKPYRIYGRNFWIGGACVYSTGKRGLLLFHQWGGSHGQISMLLFDSSDELKELGRLDSPYGIAIDVTDSDHDGVSEFSVRDQREDPNDSFGKGVFLPRLRVWSEEQARFRPLQP